MNKFEQRLNYKRYWINKKGEKILITKMDVYYIENCLRWLNRWAEDKISGMRIRYLCSGYPQGEVAEECFDRELNYWLYITPDEYLNEFPIYKSLMNEYGKRHK